VELMAETKTEWAGLAEAIADLKRWGVDLGPTIERSVKPFAESIRSQVAERVPVLTGALQGSVVLDPQADGFAISEGAGLDYAGWIEFGGSRGREHISSGRYLIPTIEAQQGDIFRVIEKIISDSIEAFPWHKAA
jgi:hypothetical protein